jgi:LmbE family N-acetylglucosaminyl deacetylase
MHVSGICPVPTSISFRSQLRPVKHMANRSLEWLWSIGFAALRRIRPSQAVRWASTGGQKILVVAPHPDDEALGCAGTILLHRRARDEVCIAIATDGRRSKVIPDPDRVAAQREREARDAARLLGVDRLAWLGHPEGDCSPRALQESLADLLRDLQPDVIYAPSRIDFHPEHLKVAHALALALSESDTTRAATIRIYRVQVPLAYPTCNLVSDVSPVSERCAAVFAAYTSQFTTVQGTLRQRRYSALLHGCEKQAEEFWEISAADYSALHRAPPESWPAAFRGLRNFSLSDPLAYLTGRTERHRLRLLAATGLSETMPPAHQPTQRST